MFENEDHQQNQIDGLQEQMKAIEDKLDELGDTDTPEVNAQREQLAQQHHELNIRLEQVLQEQEQGDEQNNDLDFFHD